MREYMGCPLGARNKGQGTFGPFRSLITGKARKER
jgi:hypothetical protein